MGWKHVVRNTLNAGLTPYGYSVVSRSCLYDWQIGDVRSDIPQATLPEEVASYLRLDNPRLLELQHRYEQVDSVVTAPVVWQDGLIGLEEMRSFRADNAYIWQQRGVGRLNYVLAAYYAKSVDRLGLLDRLEEDGAFGAYAIEIDGKPMGRDLLDSVLEIQFLEDQLGLSAMKGLNVLDIGAGYGRLATRVAQALPFLDHYYCTDAVAVSTFLCEYYVRYRGVSDKVSILPLDEVATRLAGKRIDLAVNIHSFSECSMSAVDWWFRLLSDLGVPNVLIAPNATREGGARLCLNSGESFESTVEKHGYRVRTVSPKYADPAVAEYALYPTYYHLLER